MFLPKKTALQRKISHIETNGPIWVLNTSEIKNEISEFPHKFLDESHRFPETKLFYLQSYN